jgi:hypothetical protein
MSLRIEQLDESTSLDETKDKLAATKAEGNPPSVE